MLIWPIYRMVRVSLRTHVHDVPSQDVITRDNVSIKVNAVVYYRVAEPLRAILEVEDFVYATNELSQTTLRSVAGQVLLDNLLSERERINQQLQEAIGQQAAAWGVQVELVELKHVDLPEHMKRAMAKEAEAERERRAKYIHACGELQAAEQLSLAAEQLEGHPMAMQMRFLQTLVQVGAENNSTIVFPIPIDLLGPLVADQTGVANSRALDALLHRGVSELSRSDAGAESGSDGDKGSAKH
jgi:regulator of protease activity HflC (stomatin/prohibitin superfamily)